MDIPLPDEIPLPSGGNDDNQPGPPGEGPPLPPPRPMGRGGFQRPPGPPMAPPGSQMMFRGPLPPFDRPPPLHNNNSNNNNNTRPSSERYSPSRVTGDDDEKEQMSISALFEQEQTLSHSHQPSIPMPPQQSSHPQQSISAIFDSFLSPPPQTHHPPPSGHNQGPGHGYASMPPPYSMGSQHHQHLPHGPPPGTGPPGGPPYLGPPGVPPHHGPPGPPGGPPHGPPQFGPPGTGPPNVPPPHVPPGTGPPGGPPYHGPPGPGGPPHHGPLGPGPHGGPRPHGPPGASPHVGPHHHGPPGTGPPSGPPPPGPYFSHPPPFPPFASSPPFTPNAGSSGPGNNTNKPYLTASRSNSLQFQNSQSKASKILKSFSTQNKFQSQPVDVTTSGDSNTDDTTAEDTPVLDSIAGVSVPKTDADVTSKTCENMAVGSSVTPAISATSDSVGSGETPTLGNSSETRSLVSDAKAADAESELLKRSDVSAGLANIDSGVSSSSVASGLPSIPSTVSASAAAAVSASLNVPPPSSVSLASAVVSATLNSATSVTETTGGTESNEKPIKKTMPKVLGKQGAKKRLLAYSGKLSAFALSKSTKQLSSTSLEEEDESGEKKKVVIQAKKKKKEEKMSSIEQIRNEESRIKEALGLKNVLFSPYGPGLAPITKLLDNPEELRKFEVRGKEAKIKLEEYGERSKLREKEEKEKRREKERERERRRRRDKEHEREREKENERVEMEGKSESLSKEDEESKTDAKGEQEESKKKASPLPKTWKEFKAEGYDFQSLKLAWREAERRRRSRSQDRMRGQGRGRGKARHEVGESYGQQNLFIHPVHMVNVNGLRLQYPAKMVQFTKALPSISYGINHHRYDEHYSTRLEIKNRESPEIWEIIRDFWAAKPVYAPRKKRNKGRVSRGWYREALEETSSSKSPVVEADNEEEELVQKMEKKSKKSSSNIKSAERGNKTDSVNVVQEVGQEVAKAATKSRWDSDNEEEGEASLRNTGKKQKFSSSLKAEVDKTDDKTGNDTSENLPEAHTGDTSGKVFSEGLNEEYEAFLEMLGGGSETKDEVDPDAGEYPDSAGDQSAARGRDRMEDDDKEEGEEEEEEDDKEEDDEGDYSDISEGEMETRISVEKQTENQNASEEAKPEGTSEPDKKKDKAEKKLKKQLKKAKKKQKKARKKAKKKAKKATRKKKITKKDAKKCDKKLKSDVSGDESDKSVIQLEEEDARESSDERGEESGDSRGYSEERQRAYSERNRDSADRSSEERGEFPERRRRESPERGNYERRRGHDERRDFGYRRGGNIRGYNRGEWRRDDFGDYRGRPRGRGGYDRRGRGRGFPRDFRDRREPFRDRRPDPNDRRDGDGMYERTEDYEVHREFIREKRFERKEALEEGRDFRKKRLQKSHGENRRGRERDSEIADDSNDASHSPVRTISDESDGDDRSAERDGDGNKGDASDGGREAYRRSRTDAKMSSASPSPRRRGDSEKDTYGGGSDEETRVKSKKRSHRDIEESSTGRSWKSRDSSPSCAADVDDEKSATGSHHPTSDTSGYYDLSPAQSSPSDADSVRGKEEVESPRHLKKSSKSKKGVDIKLDDIPYPPGGPPGDSSKDKGHEDSANDRYSPSNMSLSGSPSSSSPPYDFPRHSHSPSLEIPLPPSVQSIPVPPVKRTGSDDSFLPKTDLKGISLPPAGIPLPSDPQQRGGKIASVMPVPLVQSQSSSKATTRSHPESKESLPLAESPEGTKPFTVQPPKSHASQDTSERPLIPASASVKGSKSLDHRGARTPDDDLKDVAGEDVVAQAATAKWVEKSVDESDAINDDGTKNSRSVPITFRLGGSKQFAMKLQRGALPEFDHEEEEEEKTGLELERDSDDEDFGINAKRALEEDAQETKETLDASRASKSSLPDSPHVSDGAVQEEADKSEKLEKSDALRSGTPEKSQSLSRSSGSPQRSRSLRDSSPSRHRSRERSKSPRGSRTQYRSKSPQRSRSPYRSRSPQRNRSPKRNRSPRRARDSRSRSLSPRRVAGRRSPPRKRRLSPEHRRFRGSPERGKRRGDFASPPRRGGRWPRDGRSPPPRSTGPRVGKERRSPRRFSRSPSPVREDRFASPDSRHSRTPEKGRSLTSQGPRTPEGPDEIELDRSPLGRLASPRREREYWGNYKENSGNRSPDGAPSPDAVGRRTYPSPQGRKNRKDYGSSRSPSSRSPERWASRRHSPGRRSPKWSPERHRAGSPGGWRSPPYRSPERRPQYSPGRDKISPARRWSPRRSRSPRRSPLRKSPVRKSPLRRPLTHRSTSRSPIRRSRSRSPVHRSSSRSPVRRSPLRRSPGWSRSPSRRSPLRRSPGRSPIRRSPGRRSPLRRSPSGRSPRRSPRGSRSPKDEFDYDRHEKDGWNDWKWEHDQTSEHRDQERWPLRPPSPKEEPSREKYYRKKTDRKEGTLKIDADSTISDSELAIKKEPVDSTSSSPPDSPRRLSLDERLQREHGLEIEDHSKKKRPVQQTQPQLYNWGYQAHPVQVHQFQYAYEGSGENVAGEAGGSEGSSRVIQVGNMLQVLPQDTSPMIVQTGNVIQVVPAENMQMLGADVVPGIPVSSGGVMGMGGVVQVVTGGVVGMTGSSPTPVPAPGVPSPGKSSSEETAAAAVSSVLSSLSSGIQLPGASSLAGSVNQVSHSTSSLTPVTTLATNSGVTATSTTHAAGLPVAHLISLLQQQQMAGMTETAAEQEVKLAKERAREERKERKEKRRLEREARREARHKEKREARRKQAAAAAQEAQEKASNDNSDTEDEVLIREAIYEVPSIGSPVPEYEIMREEETDEDDEEAMTKKKRRLPVPLPPAEKGILMSPSFRYRREEYHPKAVKFADGILPGEGTSPSGGEEIHSPPPPEADKPKEKKLRKRKKVKVKIIKQYNVNDEDDDSPPPPPPGSPPPLAALKLYPGYTHYSYTAPGTVVIYAQQPQQAYAYASGQPQGAAVTVPGGMVIQQGANAQPQAIGSLGGVQPSVFRYPGYVYTTVYSAGQQLQYVLPTSLTSQATTSTPPKSTKK